MALTSTEPPSSAVTLMRESLERVTLPLATFSGKLKLPSSAKAIAPASSSPPNWTLPSGAKIIPPFSMLTLPPIKEIFCPFATARTLSVAT